MDVLKKFPTGIYLIRGAVARFSHRHLPGVMFQPLPSVPAESRYIEDLIADSNKEKLSRDGDSGGKCGFLFMVTSLRDQLGLPRHAMKQLLQSRGLVAMWTLIWMI